MKFGSTVRQGYTPSLNELKVLFVLLAAPDAPRYALGLCGDSDVSVGAIYAVLARLERAGWVSGRSENVSPVQAGRAARRCYTLTALGVQQAARERDVLLLLFRDGRVQRGSGRVPES